MCMIYEGTCQNTISWNLWWKVGT